MTPSDRSGDANRPTPGPRGAEDRSEADFLADPAADEALKRELLHEALELDDLNDRIAPMSDDTDG